MEVVEEEKVQEKEWQVQHLLFSVLARHLEKPHPLLNCLCVRLSCLIILLHKVNKDKILFTRIEQKFDAFVKMFQEFENHQQQQQQHQHQNNE